MGLAVGLCAPNRRAFPRWPAVFEVQYGQEGEAIRGTAVQVSTDGMLFSGPTVYPPGTELDLHFRMSNDDEIASRGVVRWHRETEMAVEFVRISRRDRQRILNHYPQN